MSGQTISGYDSGLADEHVAGAVAFNLQSSWTNGLRLLIAFEKNGAS